MLKAEPAVIAGSVKAGPARTRRAELTGLAAAGAFASAFATTDASVKSILLHPFHMATDRLEWKS